MTRSTPSEDELRTRLIGHVFPGGRFLVPPHERWLSHDAMLSPDIPTPVLHPTWILLGGLRGMGLSIDDLIRLADATPGDGVVFGETELEQIEPLVSDQSYVVEGSVVDLKRRVSRRAGTIDLLTFQLRISTEAGQLAATNTQVFVFPRRETP